MNLSPFLAFALGGQDKMRQDRGLDRVKQVCLLGHCSHLLLELRKGSSHEAE